MSGTSWEGPPDKPRTLFESMYVGAIILGVVTLGAIVSGVALFLLELLFGFIGLWLVVGLPLVVLLTAASGYTWRHIDPEDPFTYRRTYRDVRWMLKQKYEKYTGIARQKLDAKKVWLPVDGEEEEDSDPRVEDNPLLNDTEADEKTVQE